MPQLPLLSRCWLPGFHVRGCRLWQSVVLLYTNYQKYIGVHVLPPVDRPIFPLVADINTACLTPLE